MNSASAEKQEAKSTKKRGLAKAEIADRRPLIAAELASVEAAGVLHAWSGARIRAEIGTRRIVDQRLGVVICPLSTPS
jgi:hypothetical protein